MAHEPRKQFRLITFNSKYAGQLKTVNVSTAKQTGGAVNFPYEEGLQLSAGNTVSGTHPTYMDSGGTKAGLPTVFVSGYGGPL